jgi:hypothetical protein
MWFRSSHSCLGFAGEGFETWYMYTLIPFLSGKTEGLPEALGINRRCTGKALLGWLLAYLARPPARHSYPPGNKQPQELCWAGAATEKEADLFPTSTLVEIEKALLTCLSH